jgi:diguanylate cyclase (GGDEF)-like protein
MAGLTIVGSIATRPRKSTEMAATPGIAETLASLQCATWDWDIATDRLSWSPNALDLLGISDATRIATGAAFRKLVSTRSPQCREDVLAAFRRTGASDAQEFSLRYELALPKGALPVEEFGRVFLDESGRALRIAGLMRHAPTRFNMMQDSSAGLATAARAELMEWLAHAFASSKALGNTFGLITVSLSGLALVEEQNGSEVVDQLATMVLKRLRKMLRGSDRIIRYATNRIAVLLAKIDEAALVTTAKRIDACISSEPIGTESGLIPVSVTLGAIIGPVFARDPRALLRRCEEALERARRNNLNLALYEPDRHIEAERKRSQALSDDVIRALREGRLVLARQPIVAAKSRQLAFEEALLRMMREDGTIVGAAAIIPTFERLGRIELLDIRVLELAVEALKSEPQLALSVNVSAVTLRSPSWMARFEAAMKGRSDLASRIVVEMTESQAIDDEAIAKRAFAEIRALGARTAIDDFGAGYTSFRHLRGMEVDIVKIDGGFVRNVGESPDDAFFVRTLVDLARHLGIETVAEWVRDEHAANMLADWGVDYLQGDVLGPARVLAPVAPSILEAAA